MNIQDLDILIEVAQADSDEALRLLADSIHQSASAQERLDLLVKYREEYFARFRESIKTGIHATEWRNFQSFIGKLDRAIGQQKDVLERARARVVEEQQGVLRERRRLDSYDTLRDRALATEQVEEARRSQRASDEFAARAHLNAALTD